MVNFKKLKKKAKANRLGTPPEPTQTANILEVPEPSPATTVDGRTLRKTGRTEQFATRVTPAFKKRIKLLAANQGLKINELLEKALDAYIDKQGIGSFIDS